MTYSESIFYPPSTANLGTAVFPYTEKSGTYSLATTDYTINCTTGTFTLSLPDATTYLGKVYYIKNSGSGVITVDASGAQTIDGDLTIELNPFDCVTVQSTGSDWIII